MNNEPSDDFLTSKRHQASDVTTFAKSWSLDTACSATSPQFSDVIAENTSDDIRMRCESFFTNKVSPFVTCFPRVRQDSFLEICLRSRSEEEVCSSAVAYMNLCSYESIPLRIPDTCVK